MKGLSLTQPWATLVAIGAKRIETRIWATSYRGPLAIHAAKGLGPIGGKKGLVLQCARKHFLPALDLVMPDHLRGIHSPASIADRLPLGAIVAVCSLVDCRPVPDSVLHGGWVIGLDEWLLTDQEHAFGDYSPGRYAWLIGNIHALPEPVPCAGKQRLWELDAATLAAVEKQLELQEAL